MSKYILSSSYSKAGERLISKYKNGFVKHDYKFEPDFSEVDHTEFFHIFKYSGETYIRYGGEVIYFLCEDPDGFLNEVFVRDIIEIDDAVEDKLDYALTLFKLKK